MDCKGLGRRICEERNKLHLTQATFAKDIGVSDTHIGAIERGTRTPALDVLVKIATRLGVTVDYLLADSVSDSDSNILEQFKQITDGQPIDRKQLAIKVLRTIFTHYENEMGNNNADIDLTDVPPIRKQPREGRWLDK